MRRAIASGADLRRFRHRPHKRLVIGLVLFTVSMLLGWPAVSFFVALAIWTGEPFFAAIAAPGIYVLSWGIYLAAFLVGGPEAIRYLRDFNRWLIRIVVSGLIGKQGVARVKASSKD